MNKSGLKSLINFKTKVRPAIGKFIDFGKERKKESQEF